MRTTPFPSRPRWTGRRLWATTSAVLIGAGLLDAGVNYLLRWIDGRGVIGDHLGGGGPTVWWPIHAAVPEKVILALMLPALAYAASRFPLARLGKAGFALVHLPIATTFAVLHCLASVYVSVFLLMGMPLSPGAFRDSVFLYLSYYFVFDLILYSAIVGAYSAFEYFDKYQEESAATARLRESLTDVKLDALRIQLNPHFLFNALNAIAGTALLRDPERTASLVADLSRLLRRSLRTPRTTVPLCEEIELLEAYLSIERARMGSRLRTELAVEPKLAEVQVPSLLLQPLVENAIRHGVSRQPGPGTVGVDVRLSRGRLAVRVTDSGAGFGHPSRPLAPGEGGVGLANTRGRLEQLYGPDACISIGDRDGGGAEVLVELPLRWAPPRPASEPRRIAAAGSG